MTIKIRHLSKSATHNMNGGKTTQTIGRDKDNTKDQAQIWTDTDQTKVSKYKSNYKCNKCI